MRKKKWKRLLILVLLAAGLYGAKDRMAGLYRDISYDWERHSAAEETVKAFADANGISYGAYPESLIELLERNPETKDFVLNYPLRQEMEIDLSSYDLRDGIPLFLQWDQQWGYIRYGSDVAGITGCGPTCLAMAGYYLTGDARFSPDRMYEFAMKNGYYSAGNGSSWTLISEGAVKLGLDVTEIPLVKQRVLDNLEVGNPIICAMGPGDFTSSGHYILLAGLESGKIIINDPNSREKSGRLWTYDEIEHQIRNLWVIR